MRSRTVAVVLLLGAAGVIACSSSDGGNGATPGGPTPTPGHPVSTTLPTDVLPPADAAPLSGVSALTAGAYHTCALDTGGAVLCWGANGNGQLGDGGQSDSALPVNVSGVSGQVSQLSAGFTHTCAVAAGDAWCWGQDGSSEEPLLTPRMLLPDAAGLPAIGSGRAFTCAIAKGEVWCWGSNQFGQLGTGSPERTERLPARVAGLKDAIAVGAGWYFTCALTDRGTVSCWGNNQYGSLGNGATGSLPRSTPVDVVGLSNVQQLAVGGGHACVRTAESAVKCWGTNNYGQLGDGTQEDRSTPVDVIGLDSGVAGVFAGTGQSCALLESGSVKCWGHDWYGELGDGTSGVDNDQLVPVDVVGLPPDVTSIAMGRFHTCALTASGELWCWGRNGFGELGDGTRAQRATPVRALM
jgi:alpha-tubulin suppressor-like RCC1 family protein